VTGGSRGIGRATVTLLAAEGWNVAFTWRENEAEARALAGSLEGRAFPFRFELRDREAAGRLAREVEEKVGPIAGLVNNAGVRRDGLLAALPDSEWDDLLDANLGGACRCCSAVIPSMLYRRRGSIVNVSSMTAVHGLAGQAAYGAAKAGLLGLVMTMADEWWRHGIRVNAVVPGAVRTPRIEAAWESGAIRRPAADVVERMALPEDIAGAIAFLSSDLARRITGQTLVVDGGVTTRFPFRFE